MTRNCTKINARCSTKEPKPIESMLCIKESDLTKSNETEKKGGILGDIGSKITGAFSGTAGKQKLLGILVFIIAVLTAGGIVWLARKKAKARTSRKSRKR
jgi:hypothetical protein